MYAFLMTGPATMDGAYFLYLYQSPIKPPSLWDIHLTTRA